MAGKARVWNSVGCMAHGTTSAKGQTYKEVPMATPSSKGVAKKMGCPVCKKLAQQSSQ